MGDVEEDHFCKSYLLLKVEEASYFDCLRILYSNDLERRDFFNTRIEGDEVTGFRHRWIIFISLLLQKAFLYLKKPMAAAGSTVELWLNYPTFNGGYRRLFFNFFTGRLVKPDKRSWRFTSMVGNLDKRWDLKRNSNSNASSIAIMASKLSYENQPVARNVVTHHWQMEFLGFYNFWNDYQNLNSTYVIMFRDNPKRIVLAFRGTEPFDADAWRTDVDISWYDFAGVGKIHGGFMKALGMQKSTGWPKQIPTLSPKSFAYYTLRDLLKTLIHENDDSKFILTGHSLGGALAILFAGILSMHEEEFLLTRLEGVFTFGQPRVGNEQFGEYMKEKMKTYDIKYFRYVYCNDMVPRLPYDDKTFLFKHFGPCLYFDSCYKGRVLEEEPNKNYFSLIYVLPKILNAAFELIRGFFLPWLEGEEYREGWFMKLFRVIALVLPGLTDHFPLEYDNVTRLGKIPFIYDQKVVGAVLSVDTLILTIDQSILQRIFHQKLSPSSTSQSY